MVRWALIICLFLSACAQVGTITGGPTDEVAPQVLSATIANKQRNVNAKEQYLVFDEYIKLEQATQRITLMPADSRLQFETKGKNLRISFLDPLQVNTTYTLTSNGGIKDLTEGNDSLMTWTFSTGPTLDSLELFALATELSPSNKLATIQLGLYLSDTSKTARYMGRFDANGQLQLKGLKGGSYFLKAFIDENQDGVSSKTESQDQFFRPINIEEHQQDTLSFYLTKPIDEKDTAAVAVNAPVQNDSLQLSKQTSSLVLELDTLQENLMLELFLGERSVRSQKVQQLKTTIASLEAGVYTLYFYIDDNQNQKWDPIQLTKKQRTELRIAYPEKIKLRPNWELSLPVNIPANRLFKK